MYCQHCGTLNEDSSAFCKECGSPLNASPKNAEQTPPNPPQTQPDVQLKAQPNGQGVPAQKSTAKTAVLIAVCALLLCLGTVIAVKIAGSLFGGKPDQWPESQNYVSSQKPSESQNNASSKRPEENEDTSSSSNPAVPAGPANAEAVRDFSSRGTFVSADGSGGLSFKRAPLGDTPMGADGTYTIFVYMCGSDLESGNGLATRDLQEMINASTDNNVRFIIQTGGSAAWKNDIVNFGELGRYAIYGGKIYSLDTLPDASMGETDTLSGFLEWGIEYAPAAKMGLVFWDHGGGSIVGVCMDEVNQNDLLTLAEIDSALAKVSTKMTDKFEFVGFDACLMATVECANILSPYAEYMYASEELEPGYGWDYEAIGEYLNRNPTVSGDTLGKIVADSYYAQNTTPMATFSVTDLSEIDALVLALNKYAKELNAASQDYQTFSMVVRGILEAENFGTNNQEGGYTNMVDLAGIVAAGAAYANGAEEVISAIDNAVVYDINGGIHTDACGLAAYYPLYVYPNAITTFNNIAVCPYYMAFVARTAYAIEHGGDMSAYDEDEIVAVWMETWGEKEPSAEAEHYWDEYEDTETTGNSGLFDFVIEPSYYDFYDDDKPAFGFLLTEESYYNLASISTHAWKYLPEEKVLLDLGIRDAGWIKNYWDDTVTCDATGGYHTHYLKDGQPFPQYKLIGNKYDNFAFDTSVYMTPVLLNGEPVYLLSGRNIGGNQTNADGTPKPSGMIPDFIWGAWTCVSADGTIDRAQVIQIHARDVITPIYHAIDLKTGKSFDYYGEEFEIPVPWTAGIFDCLKERGKTVDGRLEEYIIYNFILTDVYGDTYETCYRMYRRDTSIGHDDEGKPTGYSTQYEHIGMLDSLY